MKQVATQVLSEDHEGFSFGISYWHALLFLGIFECIFIGAICLFYSQFGGIKHPLVIGMICVASMICLTAFPKYLFGAFSGKRLIDWGAGYDGVAVRSIISPKMILYKWGDIKRITLINSFRPQARAGVEELNYLNVILIELHNNCTISVVPRYLLRCFQWQFGVSQNVIVQRHGKEKQERVVKLLAEFSSGNVEIYTLDQQFAGIKVAGKEGSPTN